MKNPNFGIGARDVAALARARQPQQAVQQRPVATQSGGGIGSLMRPGAPRPGAPRSGTRMPDFSGLAAQIRGLMPMPENRVMLERPGGPSSGFQSPPGMRLTAPSGPASMTMPMIQQRTNLKKGGKVKAKPAKKMAKGGSTASKRADGCATKGKTKGRFV